ncbi:MAG: ATP-dependent Clp protease ATP-binding subunit [Clostridia bacterium]|nr:ATP-dependent Clp protease ATP-binding subunit [Clostridia bacterium]
MQLCSKCKKRMAVVFITKVENNQPGHEGLCLKCAKELGIKPLDDIMRKMGISEADLDSMEDDMASMMQQLTESGDNGEEGAENMPNTINFAKLMRDSGLANGGEKSDAADKESAPKKVKKKYLTTYCHNLTTAAQSGKLDKIIGRDRELNRVIQILSRRQKNNPCLIGEPGVGKTAIAEALAQRIVAGDVPYRLKKSEVYLVDLTALVAGTQFRGQFESRIQGLLNEVKEAGNIILVIDEVHNIVGAGESEGSMNAANILKPALSRGEIQVIGATTMSEYRKYIEKDTALERRFQPVTVNEPSLEECEEMLKGVKHYYEEFHGVRISDELIHRAVIMSERYITDRFLPDKAIDLIDEAAAHISLTSSCINRRNDVNDRLALVEKEYADLETRVSSSADQASEDDYKRLADLKVEQLTLRDEKTDLDTQCDSVSMTVADLADVIEIWTGIPASSISEDEYKKLAGLDDRLRQRIIGQDEAVSAVSRAIRRNRAGVSAKRKPVSFIFAGPTGVGKTELVKTLANDLFNSPESLIRLDMSEFMEKHSVSRIIGAPPGYVGYDEAGQLTEKIRRKPYSVILFDEIEKAHPDVMNILLQILDEGKITDAHGKHVNFENTVIVMTTNAGSHTSSAPAGFSESESKQASARTEKALAEFLRPEFLNRIDEIITFRSLDKNDFRRIADIMLNDLKKALEERGITFRYTEAARDFIADASYSVKYGARNMRRYIQTEVEDRMANAIISGYETHITAASLDAVDGALSLYCL